MYNILSKFHNINIFMVNLEPACFTFITDSTIILKHNIAIVKNTSQVEYTTRTSVM